MERKGVSADSSESLSEDGRGVASGTGPLWLVVKGYLVGKFVGWRWMGVCLMEVVMLKLKLVALDFKGESRLSFPSQIKQIKNTSE